MQALLTFNNASHSPFNIYYMKMMIFAFHNIAVVLMLSSLEFLTVKSGLKIII